MASDMIAATLWLPEGKEPNWEAAHKALTAFKPPTEDGFPADSPLKDGWLEEDLLNRFIDADAVTEADRKKVTDKVLADALRTTREAYDFKTREMTTSTFAGWVVSITGGPTSGDSPTDAAEAIFTLSGTGILEAAGFFKKPDKVMAVVLESEHATTVELVADENAAEKVVADFCRQFWQKVVVTFESSQPPENDKEVIEKFFADAPSSWWEQRQWVSTENVAI